MPSPLLLIDAGNSYTKWALADAQGARMALGAFSHDPNPSHVISPSPCLSMSIPAEPAWSALPEPESVWISNVAGDAVAQRIAALIHTRWPQTPQHRVSAQPYQCGVTNRYRDNQQLGSDRWAGLIGARAAYPHEPLLIAMLGTATTLNALNAEGVFIGGLIAAGPTLMMQALSQGTAQLPNIIASDITPNAVPEIVPEVVSERVLVSESAEAEMLLGLDTHTSISVGCWLAQAALIERVYCHLQAGIDARVRCILSGGGAAVARSQLKIPHTYDEHLVLSGLAQIATDCWRPCPTQREQQAQ